MARALGLAGAFFLDHIDDSAARGGGSSSVARGSRRQRVVRETAAALREGAAVVVRREGKARRDPHCRWGFGWWIRIQKGVVDRRREGV
jgi:hypothetical protein